MKAITAHHFAEAAEIKAGVVRVAAQFPDEYWRRMEEEHTFPWDFFNAMAEGGWTAIALPEQYGGGGAGIQAAATVIRAVAESGAGMNGTTSIHGNVFGVEPIVRFGSDEMRQRYLPQVAKGTLQVAFGVTEPDAGSDTTRISTRAVRTDGGYRITGQKVWMSKAQVSEKALLLARTTPREEASKRTEGMTLFMADIQRPEVDIRAIPKLGRNAVSSCEVRFDGLFVDDADVVGEIGQGFTYLLSGLNAERVLIAAGAVGLGFRALERAVEYANERVVFDRPIGSNQGVAFPLADSYMRLNAAALMVDHAGWLYDNGHECGIEASAAKYLASDAGFEAADRAMQVHGGYGYAKEYDVERYWREARLMRLGPLSQELIQNHMAVHALGLPRSF